MADIAKKLFDEELKDEDGEAPPTKEPLKVFLRIRPLSEQEQKAKEDQGCLVRKGEDVVELNAPPNSFTFKSSNRGFNDSTHQFSFSHVFPEPTTQKHFFNQTMLPLVKEVLNGVNGLVFTYGVTNSGKTYTFQGTPEDGGIVPRSLDVIFNSISSKKYVYPNIKPKFCHEVTYLSKQGEAKEEDVRQNIFSYEEKENNSTMRRLNSTTKFEKTTVSNSRENSMFPDISMIQSVGSTSNVDIDEEIRSRIMDNTNIELDTPTGVKFGMWVSFMEIYNELIHDLLDVNSYSGPGIKKRPALKLGEDKNRNPYVRGLTEVFVTSSDEAYKVLRVGQKNKHVAATKLNQNSSRSHSIFSIKIMKIVNGGGEEPHVSRISRLSIVDLAGSERYCKTDAQGVLLKEASNINCSIMTLGKCISTLRYNQEHQNHPTIVPFRESKLTRLFQSYFRGKGKAQMVVNISPCASVFDETYNVLKFSSVAKEIKMKAERNTEMWRIPPVPKLLATPKPFATPKPILQAAGPATPVQHKRPTLCIMTPSTQSKKDRSLNNPNDFNYNELVCIVKELNEKIKKERKEKAALERTIRGEIMKEMDGVLKEVDQSHRNELNEQKDSMNQLMENRLDLLTKTVEKQRKRKRMRQDENDESGESEASSVYLEAEKLKVVDLEEKLTRYRDHIHALEDENGKLRSLEKDFSDLEETYQMQNKSMKDMQMKLESKDDQIEKLLEELEDSQRDSQHVINDGFKKRIVELEAEIENLKQKEASVKEVPQKQNDELTYKFKEAENSLSNFLLLEKQVEELTHQLKEAEKSVTSVEALQKQVDELTHKLKESEDSASSAELLEKQVDELTHQLKEAEKSVTSVEALQKQVDELTHKLKESEDSVSSVEALQKQVDELTHQLKEFEDSVTSVEALQKQVDQLTHQLKESEDSVTSVEALQKQVDQLTHQLKEFEDSVTSVEALQKQVDQLTHQLKESEDSVTSVEALQKLADKLTHKLKEAEEAADLMQFESDEKNIQLEKYESMLKQQQDTLGDSDNIILQLNENLFLLKSQLDHEQMRNSYETQPSFEVGVNTSLPFTEAKAEVVLTETGMNTSMAVEQSEKSDASCNTPMMKDDKPKQQQLCGVGINTSTSTIDREAVLSESNNSTLEEDSLQVEPRSMMTSSSFVEEQLTEELEQDSLQADTTIYTKVTASCTNDKKQLVEEQQTTLDMKEGMTMCSETASTSTSPSCHARVVGSPETKDGDEEMSIEYVDVKESSVNNTSITGKETLNQVSQSEIATNTSILVDDGYKDREEVVEKSEIGTNTSILEEKNLLSTEIGTNTSILIEEVKESHTAEIGINTSVCAQHEQTPRKISLVKEVEKQFLTPGNQKVEVSNTIESIEGFKLEVKSAVRKVKNEEYMTPERLFSPKKPFTGTPKGKHMSPYSPASRGNLQSTIKQFEKLLEEAKKDSDKKASLIVTRNNRIQSLESQLSALEKKTNVKKLMIEKTALLEELSSMSDKVQEMTKTLDEKTERIESTNAEVKVWMSKTEKVQSELSKATGELSMWENKYKLKGQESQELLDSHMSKISVLTNDKMELIKEMDPLKVALGRLEEERNQLLQDSNEQVKSIADFEFRVGEMQKVINLKSAELDNSQKEITEKENLLSLLQQEKENVISHTTKLNNELKDRRKSRVASHAMMESSLENFKERVVTLQIENEENLEEISSLRKTIFEVQSKCNDMESCFNEASAAKEMLAKSEVELLERVEDLKSKLSQCEAETRKLNGVNLKQDMKLQTVEAEREEIKLTLEDEINDLKKELHEVTTKYEALTPSLNELQKKEQELILQNEDHIKNIDKLTTENEDLSNELQKKEEEKILQNKDHIENIGKLTTEKEDLCNELQKKEEEHTLQNEDHNKTIEKLTTENEDLSNELQKKEELILQNEDHIKNIEKLTAEKEDLSNELQRKEELILQNKDHIKNIEKLTTEKEDLSNELQKKEELILQNEDHIKNIEKLTTEKEDLSNELKKKEELILQNEDHIKNIEKLTTEKEDLSNELQKKEELILQNEDHIKNIEKLTTENEDLSNKLQKKEELILQNEDHIKTIEKLTTEKEDLSNELQNKEELILQNEDHFKNIEKLTTEKEDLSNELQKKEELILRNEVHIKTIEKLTEDLSKKLQKKEQELILQNEGHVKNIEKLTTEKEVLNNDMKEILTQITNSHDEIQQNTVSESNTSSKTRRSKRSTTGSKKNPADDSKASIVSDTSKCTSILPAIDETEYDYVEQVSMACSPMPLDEEETPLALPSGLLESTRCEPNATINDETSGRRTPSAAAAVPKKRQKRLKALTTSVFADSPDGIERTTGNEKEIENATLPIEIKGRRVTRSTRSTRSSVRK